MTQTRTRMLLALIVAGLAVFFITWGSRKERADSFRTFAPEESIRRTDAFPDREMHEEVPPAPLSSEMPGGERDDAPAEEPAATPEPAEQPDVSGNSETPPQGAPEGEASIVSPPSESTPGAPMTGDPMDTSGVPQTYTVQSGDTLSTISQHLFGSAQYWKRIYQANRDQLDDPDALQVGQILNIPEITGE